MCQEIDSSMFQGKEWIMGSEVTSVDPYALVFYGWGRARWVSHEGSQRLHGIAGAHDEAADGAEICRRRAERFVIIASLRSDA
jgi:hypothetical protein